MPSSANSSVQPKFQTLCKGSTAFVKSGTYHRPDLTHLHVVCTAPDSQGRQVLVPICSWKNSLCDPTCDLDVGDHAFLQQRSYVMYAKATLRTQSEIADLFGAGDLIPDEPLVAPATARVVSGLCRSPQTKRQIKSYLGC